MNNTTITVGSVTYAIKARRILLHGGIRATLTKVISNENGGCNHGVVIPSSRFYDAVVILKSHGISYSVYSGG